MVEAKGEKGLAETKANKLYAQIVKVNSLLHRSSWLR